MKPEQRLWEALRPHFQDMHLDPVRVENLSANGTPDVNYSAGWVELKELKEWPKRAGTPVRVTTLQKRTEQVAFLMRRWQAGYPAYLLLRVEGELLLFSGWDSRAVRQGRTRQELYELAVYCEKRGRRNDEALRAWLTWDRGHMTLAEQARFLRVRCCKSVDALAVDMGVLPSELMAAERGERFQLASDIIEHFEC